jgi:ABC-type phosphate/phosphonate transport system substrate-binding protein
MSAVSESVVAALPMYDLPELRWATDLLWHGLARHLRLAGLGEVPAALTRPQETAAVWGEPGLLLAQTCGYPLTHAFRDRLLVVGAPVYEAEGCEPESRFGPTYRSAIVVRADEPALGVAELAGRRAAINGRDSQSGMSALRALVAPHARKGRFFGEVVETGAHAASAAAVAAGRADVAAIDCVTWALLGDVRPDAVAPLRVLAWSTPAPTLPFVTSLAHIDEVHRIAVALTETVEDDRLAEACAALRLAGMAAPEAADYRRILEIESAAEAQGYPVLQ